MADPTRTLPPFYLAKFSSDEALLFGEAIKAGAVVAPGRFDDYMAGEAVAPIQWEGTYPGLLCDDPLVLAHAEARRAERDAFLLRVREGDLRAVAERVVAARGAQAQRAA